MKKYIIFIDVDGTLVTSGTHLMDKKIPQMFEKVQKQGHIVVVVTGRCLESTFRIKGIEKAQYICGLMGCVVVDGKTKKKITNPTPMDKQAVKNFVNDINGAGYKWTYKDDFYEKTTFNDDAILKKYSAKLVSVSEQTKDIESGNIFQLLVDGELSQDIITKYSMFDYFNMPTGYYDVTLKGVSKANVVEYFKKLYPEHTSVAIGDSNNDLPMFKNCEIKIAMGNSKEDIKKVATYITKDLKECGVCYAIEEILKI